MSNARYLKISLHDNDFTIIIEFSSELLKELIDFFDYYGSYEISEKDLYKLQDSIQHLLYATYRIHNYLFHRDYEDMPFDSFRPSLHIVDYLDIRNGVIMIACSYLCLKEILLLGRSYEKSVS